MEEDHRWERRAMREEKKRLAKEQMEKEAEEKEEEKEKPEEPEQSEQATAKDSDETEAEGSEGGEKVSSFGDCIDNMKGTDEPTQKNTTTADPGQVSNWKKKPDAL